MSRLRDSIFRAMRIADPTPDALLVSRAANGDADAVRALINRHGPMVLRVCRNLLADEHAADDAFQAVFLILIRRKWRIARPERLAAFLFGTARRTALKAKTAALRRQRRERRVEKLSTPEPSDELTARELLAGLDAELERLPEAQRLPLLLCYWQGLSHVEAARRLGWTSGSVKGRLERGRKQLSARLTKRGLAPSVLLTASATSAFVSKDLSAATLALASGIAAPAGVLALIGSGSMVKTISAITAAVVLVGAGVLGMTAGFAAPDPVKNEQPPAPQVQPAAERRDDVVTVRGRVLDPNGKPVAGAKVYTLKILPEKELFISEENVEPVFRATTGQDGAFQFNVPKDKLLVEHNRLWPVMAVADGFGLGWTRAQLPEDELAIRLVEDQPIDGQIVNAQGQPVPDARLRVCALYTDADDRLDAFLDAWKSDWQNSWGQIRKRTVPPSDAVRVSPIDRNGRFTITGAGVDRVVVFEVTAPSMAMTRGYIVNRPGFDAAPLNAIAGKENTGENRAPGFTPIWYGPKFQVTLKPGKTMSGIVRSPGGVPAAGVRVETMPGWGCWAVSTTDADGRFTLVGLSKKPKYLVRARTISDDSPMIASIEVPDTDGAAPMQNVDITLRKRN